MFILPILIVFIALVITVLIVAADDRVYLINMQLDALVPVAVILFGVSGLLSILLFIAGV